MDRTMFFANPKIYFRILVLFIFTMLFVTIPNANATEQEPVFNQNIEKLTEFVSKDNKMSIDNLSPENFPKSLSTKKLQGFIYMGNQNNYVIPESDSFDDIEAIKLIFADESTEIVNIKKDTSSTHPTILFQDIVIYESNNESTEEIVNDLSTKIKSIDLDTLLKPYGGRLPATTAMGDSSLYLREIHVADSNQIDIYNLDYALEDLQTNSKQTAEKLLAPFTDYHLFDSLSSSEKIAFKDKINRDFNSLLFAYLYFYKWYGYEIGNVKVNDLIYAKSDLFSKDIISSEDSLYKLIEGFSDDPWPTVEGYPWVYSLFQTEYIFDATSGLRSNNRGFTLDQFSEGTISCILEYLIRILEGTSDYNNWFTNQGFIIAYGESTGIDILDNQQHDVWTTLKYFERGVINKKYAHETYNPSIFTILLSMENRNSVSLAVSSNDLTFVMDYGDTSKNKTITQTVANDKNAFLSFIWNTGTEQVKNSLQSMVESNWIYINIDTGELNSDGKKNFYLRSSYFLRDFLTPLSYVVAKNSSSNIGGVALSHSVILAGSYASLSSEYTISHESTHLYDEIMLGGESLRIDAENIATLVENQANIYGWDTPTLNYYYSNTQTDGWNRTIPENNKELKNYTKNFLDLNTAWNIAYAEYIFNNIEENYDKVYQINYSPDNGSNVVATRMSKEDINALNIDTKSSDFISKLVENRIFLPTDNQSNEITISTGYGYDLLSYRRNAFFYVPAAKDQNFKDYPKNYIDAITHFWLFESMATTGMDGYRDYATNTLGEDDFTILSTIFGKDPSDYLIDQYRTVQAKVSSNQLIDYSYKELQEEVKTGNKADFIQTYMETHDNVQGELFGESSKSTAVMEISDVQTDAGIIGQQSNLSMVLKHSDSSDQKSTAENISLTLNFGLDLDLNQKVTLSTIDKDGNSIEEKTIDIIGDKISLPDLDYSYQYRLTFSGIHWNNTIYDGNPNYSIELTYNDGLKNQSVTSEGFWKVSSGLFGFADIPQKLEFQNVKDVSEQKYISERLQEDWAISVNDFRGTALNPDGSADRSDWEVLASTSGFTNSNGETVSPTSMNLIFVENGKETIIDSTEVSIVTHKVGSETPKSNNKIVTKWAKEEGFKVAIYDGSSMPSNETYHASVAFELRVAP